MKKKPSKKKSSKRRRSRKNLWESVDLVKGEATLFKGQDNPTKINLGIDLNYLTRKIEVVCNFFFDKWIIELIDFDTSIVSVAVGNKRQVAYLEDINLAYYDNKNKILKKKNLHRYFTYVRKKSIKQRSKVQRTVKGSWNQRMVLDLPFLRTVQRS
jgi:hypothetical protein